MRPTNVTLLAVTVTLAFVTVTCRSHSLNAQLAAAQDTGRVYAMTAVDVLPERVSCPGARFPGELTEAYDAAEVQLVFIVGLDGGVEPGSILVMSSTDPGFEAPVMDMIAQCQFRPGMKGGKAVRVQLRRPIRFTFSERPGYPALDSLNMTGIFSLGDTVGGRPVLTQMPELITCPRYDPRERPARERAADRYEREREVERLPEHVDAILEIVVAADGIPEPRLSKVVQTSDFRFSQTLLQWVQSCRFRPGMIQDHAVRVRMEFPVKFTFARE